MIRAVEVEMTDGRTARVSDPKTRDLPAYLRALPSLDRLMKATNANQVNIPNVDPSVLMQQVQDLAPGDLDALWILLARVTTIKPATNGKVKGKKRTVEAKADVDQIQSSASGISAAEQANSFQPTSEDELANLSMWDGLSLVTALVKLIPADFLARQK